MPQSATATHTPCTRLRDLSSCVPPRRRAALLLVSPDTAVERLQWHGVRRTVTCLPRPASPTRHRPPRPSPAERGLPDVFRLEAGLGTRDEFFAQPGRIRCLQGGAGVRHTGWPHTPST